MRADRPRYDAIEALVPKRAVTTSWSAVASGGVWTRSTTRLSVANPDAMQEYRQL